MTVSWNLSIVSKQVVDDLSLFVFIVLMKNDTLCPWRTTMDGSDRFARVWEGFEMERNAADEPFEK